MQIRTPYAFWIFTTPFFIHSLLFHTLFILAFIAFLMLYFGHVLFIPLYLTWRWFRRSIWLKSRICNQIYSATGDGWCFCFNFFFLFCFFLGKIRDFTVNSNCSCITWSKEQKIIEWQTCFHFYFVDNFIEPLSFGEKVSLSKWILFSLYSTQCCCLFRIILLSSSSSALSLLLK